MAARINRAYDKHFIKKILKAWGKVRQPHSPFLEEKTGRAQYQKFVKSIRGAKKEEDSIRSAPDVEELAQDPGSQNEDLLQPHLKSAVLTLFTARKKGKGEKYPATHASNFRKRFTVSSSPFSIFFKPALDYKAAPYKSIYSLRNTAKEKNYPLSADWERLKERDGGSGALYTLRQEAENKIDEKTKDSKTEYQTLWSLYFEYLKKNAHIEKNRKVSKALEKLEPFEKEALSKYLYKGLLFASPCLIELYCCFIRIEKYSQQRQYHEFIKEVKKIFARSILPVYIGEAICNFKIFIQKIIGESEEEKIVNSNWNFLNNQDPAYPVSGDTQDRQRPIRAFNSPFFPNVLVSTSVLQEGVNLHLYCKNVHHYGIAWTPGDNEQRTGRIDRMFGLIEREIDSKRKSALHISYPYLKGTFDETQLGNFIIEKRRVESDLDKGSLKDFDKEIDEVKNIDEWKSYLRKPSTQNKKDDPYPALFDF